MSKKLIDREKNSRRGLGYWRWRYIDNFGRRLKRDGRRAANATEAALDDEMLSSGIVVEPAENLLSATGLAALTEISCDLEFASSETRKPEDAGRGTPHRKKKYLTHLLPETFDGRCAYVRLALDPKLLGHVSRYLGFKPFLFDIKAWLNQPSSQPPAHSQLWRRDPEDRHLVKAFFYLGDVSETTDPFEFIPRTHSKGEFDGVAAPHDHPKRVLDGEMTLAFPRKTWQRCTGPAGTAILADTTGYHRGGHVERGRRVLLTMTYTSGRPVAREKRKIAISGAPEHALDDLQRSALYATGSSR